MFRKLIAAFAVSLALLPGSAAGLGLGGIRAESALNEPFVAEIELNDAPPDELDTVKVSLAPPSEFSRVGAPRPHFLTKLRFSTQMSPSGSTVILVTSTEPIREPYLDFLVEVNWPKGRLIKEYTVLLDPPVTTARSAPRVERPSARRASPPDPAQAAPARVVPAEARPARAPAGTRDATGYPLSYGPVKSGTGLWRVAQAMAPPGASIAQTAMALYRNNQDAFIRGDINKLKLGAQLSIPTPDELFALDRDLADREFRTALGGGRVTATPLADVTRAAQPTDRLEIAAAPAAETPAQAPTREAEAPAREFGAIQKDLLMVQEAGESTRQETDELRARISELEEQLADIRKLLQLRNEQLAQIQASMGQSEPVPDEAPPSAVGEGELQKPAEALGEEVKEAPGAPLEGPVLPAVVEAEPALPAVPAAPPAESAPPERPPAAAAFWEKIPTSLLAIGAGVPVLLALMALLVVRRRRRLAESLPPTDYGTDVQSASSGTVLGLPAAEVVSAASSEEAGAVSAQLSTPYSALGEEETGEADVISEADVYVAYGRYREAEALLTEEIEASPDRMDLKLKLAEAYVGARNGEALAGLIAELREAGADRRYPEQWRRLQSSADELGAERMQQPETETLASRPAPAVGAESSPGGSNLELDVGGLLEEDSLEEPPKAEARSAAWESDWNQEAQAIEATSREGLHLDVEDLDLADSGLVLPEEPVTFGGEPPPLERSLDEFEGLDDLWLEPSEETPAAPEPAAPGGSRTSSGLRLDSLDIAPVGKDRVPSDELSSQWQMDSGLPDEVATKIDLARAYIEMEDPDAARAILDEVVAEGNEEQRKEAEEMLSRLG